MGDMADYALDQASDIDEMGDGRMGRVRVKKAVKITCRHCHKSGLIWIHTKDGWRTSDDGKQAHKCPFFSKGANP